MSRPTDVIVPSEQATPETYLGTARAQGWVNGPHAGMHDYGPGPHPHLDVNEFAYTGTWNIAAQPAEAVSGRGDRSDVPGQERLSGAQLAGRTPAAGPGAARRTPDPRRRRRRRRARRGRHGARPAPVYAGLAPARRTAPPDAAASRRASPGTRSRSDSATRARRGIAAYNEPDGGLTVRDERAQLAALLPLLVAGPRGPGPLRGDPQDRPRHGRALGSRGRAAGGRRAVPGLHARPAPPGLQQRPRRTDRRPLGADDRGHALGRLVHGVGRRRRRRELLRARRPATRCPTPRSATTACASSSRTCAFTSTKRTRASSCTCSSSCTRARWRRPPRCSSPPPAECSRSPRWPRSHARRQRPARAQPRTDARRERG